MKNRTISILAAALALAACSTTQSNLTTVEVKASYLEQNVKSEDLLLFSSIEFPTYITGINHDGTPVINKQLKKGYELWVEKNENCYFKVYQIDKTDNLDGTVDPSMTVTQQNGDCQFASENGLTIVTAKLDY